MSEEYLRENLRLKNKINAMQKEKIEDECNHKRDIQFYQSKLKDMEIQRAEEETLICCKDLEEIAKLEKSLIDITEKVRRIRCVYLSAGLILGYVLARLV